MSNLTNLEDLNFERYMFLKTYHIFLKSSFSTQKKTKMHKINSYKFENILTTEGTVLIFQVSYKEK